MFTVNQLLNTSILITSIPSCSTLWQDYTLLIWWLWSPRQLFCQSFLGFFIFQTGQYDIDICKLWVNILGECPRNNTGRTLWYCMSVGGRILKKVFERRNMLIYFFLSWLWMKFMFINSILVLLLWLHSACSEFTKLTKL